MDQDFAQKSAGDFNARALVKGLREDPGFGLELLERYAVLPFHRERLFFNSMRLFTAIDLSPAVLESLEGLTARLRPTARIKWTPVENLHITTKFIGEWPEERLEELAGALRGLPRYEPMEIALRGVGFFPNPHSPRVFWVAVHAPASLGELARQTELALGRLGVPAENRPFSPHLTLARVKEPVPMAALRQAIAALPSLEFGEFTADRFCLYHSQLNPSGSVYTKLSEFLFSE